MEIMKRFTHGILWTVLVLCCLTAWMPTSQAKPSQGDFSAALEMLRSYDFNRNREPLSTVAEMVRDSSLTPGERKKFATMLAEMLSSDVSRACKDFLCRQLALIGTEDQVPALSPLLEDSEYSDMARYALERIGGKKSAAALRAALTKTSGKTAIGIVNSLGQLEDTKAITAIEELAFVGEPALASCAVAALGKIGGPNAGKALRGLSSNAREPFLGEIEDAELRCADSLASARKGEQAIPIYYRVYANSASRNIRSMAIRGIYALGGQDLMKQMQQDAVALGVEQERKWNDDFLHAMHRDEEGFVSMFNGKDLEGWQGSDFDVADGLMICHGHHAGYLAYTKSEFTNFVMRFEFNLTPGANNGLNFRTDGSIWNEVQVLDDSHSTYTNIHPYQAHGSIYGVVPARRGFLKPAGQWNDEEVTADGSRIRVVLNGTVIVDVDLSKLDLDKCLDGTAHPGLRRRSGGIAWLGHLNGYEKEGAVYFRSIRIKKLP